MPRYIPDWRNNSFVVELEAAADKLGNAWEDAYVVYAILDPTKRDYDQRYGRGTPFYVGQTNRIGRRILQHFRAARWTPKGGNRVWLRLGTIMYARRVPEFVVLEECGSRLDALRQETIWAQRLLSEGYELCNKYRDQKKPRLPRTVAKDLKDKLKWLTVREAINASAVFTARCSSCCNEREIDLRPLREIKTGSSLRVKNLKHITGTCDHCWGTMSIFAYDPEEWREKTRQQSAQQPQPAKPTKETMPCSIASQNSPAAEDIDLSSEFIDVWISSSPSTAFT